MTNSLTYLQAIEIILRDAEKPLLASELVSEIRKRRLIDSDYETQFKTVNARLSVDIRRKGDESLFKRVIQEDKIFYTLREMPGQEYLPRPHGRSLSEDDRVLVFDTVMLDKIGHFHGVSMEYEKYEAGLLLSRSCRFMNRLDAEADNKYRHKQVVSYVLVKYKSKLLRYTRGVITNVGQYLRGEYSIGFGGHVEEDPDWKYPLFTPDYGYKNSVFRELQQEIGINFSTIPKYKLKMIGVLNDDTTPLGRRHFAFIHLLEILELPKENEDGDEFYKKGEKSINNLQLININKISDHFSGYEYWSKLCLQTFYTKHLSFNCHINPKPNFSLKKMADLILFVGYIGSGKSEACNLLAEEFGYTLVPCSTILQKEIKCPPMAKIGRQKLQEIGFKYINQPNGHKLFAKAIVKYMKKNPSKKFVLDGLRYPKTLLELRKLLDKKVAVIYIESTIDNLFRYYLKRKLKGDGRREFKQFLEIVYHPVEREIERFWPLASITVYNHGTKDAYINTLREFFKEELS